MYSFLAIIIVVVLAMGVYAYNTANVPVANPAVFGHTSNEITFLNNTVPPLSIIGGVGLFKRGGPGATYSGAVEIGDSLNVSNNLRVGGNLECSQWVEVQLANSSSTWTNWVYDGSSTPTNVDTCNGDNNSTFTGTPSGACKDVIKLTSIAYGDCGTQTYGECAYDEYQYSYQYESCGVPGYQDITNALCQQYQSRDWVPATTAKVCLAGPFT